MANYPIPAWLTPQAAQGWGDLTAESYRTGASILRGNQEAAASAQDAAIRSQELSQKTALQQQQIQQDAMVEQQKIAIEKAYNDATIGLKQQDQAEASREFELQTQQAASKFAANQLFQKSMLPKEQGGEGLTAQQAALKYLSTYMTPDALGRMATRPPPFTLGNPVKVPGITNMQFLQTSPNHWSQIPVPASATGDASTVPIRGQGGQVIGYWAYPPGGGKPVRIGLPKSSGLEATMEKLKGKTGGGDVQHILPDSTKREINLDTSRTDEVIRMYEGRRAAFDPKTRQFLRWVDDTPSQPKTEDADAIGD
jgi:hypothetical protein